MSNTEATAEEQLDALLRDGQISPQDYDTLRQAMSHPSTAEGPCRRATKRPKLTKNWAGRQLGGVCAGLADFFGTDPWRVRFIFVLALLLSGGTALMAYLLLYIALPWSGRDELSQATEQKRRGRSGAFAGSLAVLWLFGILLHCFLLPQFVALFTHSTLPLPGVLLYLMNIRQVVWGNYVGLAVQIPFLALVFLLFHAAPERGFVRRALPQMLAVGTVLYVLAWVSGIVTATLALGN